MITELKNFYLFESLNYLYFLSRKVDKMSKMKSSRMSMDSIIDFVTSGDISELSELSSDDESDDEREIMVNIQREEELESDNDDRGYDEDDIPLALLQTEEDDMPLAQLATDFAPSSDTTLIEQPSNQTHIYRWQKKDRPITRN